VMFDGQRRIVHQAMAFTALHPIRAPIEMPSREVIAMIAIGFHRGCLFFACKELHVASYENLKICKSANQKKSVRIRSIR
jgi:hypothetical protein